MELVELEVGQVTDDEIRARYMSCRDGRYTKHFIAKDDGKEVGFLAIDPIPEYEHFIIYTIFVPKQLRKQGFGSRLLDAAEQLGRDYGYGTVLLTPRPLDSAIPRRELAAWYRKRGYALAPEPNPAEDFVKSLRQ